MNNLVKWYLLKPARSTTQIQQHAISLILSSYFVNNRKILFGKSFNPMAGFANSMIVSTCTTLCAVYFSTLTAYGLVVYDWKLQNTMFSIIMATVFFMRQYMLPTLSMEIIQSARIDGAKEFFIFSNKNTINGWRKI